MIELILAGASAVAVGTATFGPWPAGSAQPYTIHLLDGVCSGTAAGVVTIP